MLELFQTKVAGNDLARLGLKGKPAPDMFLHAAAELGVQPSHAVVVEDAFSGVQAGRAGGFGLVVGVARNGNPEALKRQGADVVVDDLRNLEIGAEAIMESSAAESREPPRAALEHFDEIASRLAKGQLALFLDYDGTLTPIVDRAEDATLSDAMRSLLANLSSRYPVAIVSGRDLSDVRQMVGLENLVYAGSHGFDIAGPDGLQLQHEAAQQRLPELDAADADLPQIEAAVDEVHDAHPSLRKKGGKKIFELQPDVAWHKGRAVLWLRQELDVQRGMLTRCVRFRDQQDREPTLVSRRIVHMEQPDLAAIEWTPTPENGRAAARSTRHLTAPSRMRASHAIGS